MSTYAVTAQISVSAAIDLLRITPQTGTRMRLVEAHVTNSTQPAEEMLVIGLYRATTNGGAGTAVIPVVMDPGDGVFGGSAAYSLSAIATKDATLDRQAFHNLTGYHFIPQKKSRPVLNDDYRMVMRLEAAPDSVLTLDVTAIFEVDGAAST